MSQVVIENPIINSPFDEPSRHFAFTDEGITNEVVDGRRISTYFVPIARPKKKSKEKALFDTEWTEDRLEENKLVNRIRGRVARWREGGHIGVTPTTARLLAYWTDPNRENPDVGRHAGGRPLRQKRPPWLYHPLHTQRRRTAIHSGLHRLHR
jgi:type III restriction enzyme